MERNSVLICLNRVIIWQEAALLCLLLKVCFIFVVGKRLVDVEFLSLLIPLPVQIKVLGQHLVFNDIELLVNSVDILTVEYVQSPQRGIRFLEATWNIGNRRVLPLFLSHRSLKHVTFLKGLRR